jgi:16S rRNA (guanine527-N7)-methyltransferase
VSASDDGPTWVDVGSGGGSPAVPLRIAGLEASLTMVESKVRKAAFLREVVRTLELPRAIVENDRIEALAARQPGSARLVTVRAVRLDVKFLAVARQLLQPGGSLALFCQAPLRAAPVGFDHVNTVRLIEGQPSYVVIFRHIAQQVL